MKSPLFTVESTRFTVNSACFPGENVFLFMAKTNHLLPNLGMYPTYLANGEKNPLIHKYIYTYTHGIYIYGVCVYIYIRYIWLYMWLYICIYIHPPTPADGKGERVREERLWTTRNRSFGKQRHEKKVAKIIIFYRFQKLRSIAEQQKSNWHHHQQQQQLQHSSRNSRPSSHQQQHGKPAEVKLACSHQQQQHSRTAEVKWAF